ncbi:MAG: right-handed parallel beta-helix repeat-containing protein, partial [Saprospiraceae bacterium]|nr:right-handed parallel beta-helix repeat-containing protein [Saprospiraceae bacterium]
MIFRNNSGCSGCDGGAVFITDGAAPVFEDCLFENNQTDLSGAGVFSLASSPVFHNSIFVNNGSAGNQGGAVWLSGGSSLFLGCTFAGNAANIGSAIGSSNDATTIIGSIFTGNVSSSPNTGGTLYFSFSRPRLVANSVVVGNRSNRGGGIVLAATGTSDFQVVNTTIGFNEAQIEGGGIYSKDFGSPFTEARFENVIVWGNTAPEGANIFWDDFDSGPPEVTRSIVGGGYEWGTDILDEDPLFVRNPDPGPDMTWGTEDDDYGDLRLRSGSPGIDYGLEAFLPADTWDLDGDGNTTEPL